MQSNQQSNSIQEISDAHPELFHYTSRQGLDGILSSQCLWATHYKFLNDTSELQLMRAEFVNRIEPLVKEQLFALRNRGGLRLKRKISKEGGISRIARGESRHLAEAFYRTAFEASTSHPALAEPYITSFCAHTADDEYERKNGLLSQWRGYAKGGFAIVFDTKKLFALYRAEAERFYYATSCWLGDVVYQGDEQAFQDNFRDSLERIKDELRTFSETREMEAGKIFDDVVSLFTRLKHRGFREEREVRAIAFPMTEEIETAYKSIDPKYVAPDKEMKEILFRDNRSKYIETLKIDSRTKLPITRIIIGPQKDQEKTRKEIKTLLHNKLIKVHCSETPLIWPGT